MLDYKSDLDQGRDPQQLKFKRATDYISQPTVKEISKVWFLKVAKDKVAQPDDMRAFELHLYPKCGKRICDEITLQEWSSILFDIAEKANTVAVKILGNLRMIMRWGGAWNAKVPNS
ncbi:hypothetical protein [Acinetobacter gerneri]|uniref:Uncharacterized protein n=1 Tax=Acinetobacter gerneri DSM 14967 = CIP 107464 = MTCC 9824 TaxID=1120926 RepID=N8Y949_9GAMM|nr:hypothetical protein [Acinetobacter gerneri]ENV33161.1 hypothetical protein F960_02883 [Acinetobacter gerneri DSM 14967 = CIP 107464 = MTCC 9824]